MDLHLNTVSIESGIVVPEMSVSGIPELAISASSSYRAMFIIKLCYIITSSTFNYYTAKDSRVPLGERRVH